jgi:hypothetical protein
MKNVFLIVALAINIFGIAQTIQQFNIISYTSYQARGLKKFNDVIANSFNTIQKDYKQTVVVHYDTEYGNIGAIITYDETDFFGSQREIKNFKQVGNSITFDYNEYCWVQQEYIPAFLKTFKFSANNSFMPIVYFYNPLDDTTYLIKYETID